MIKIDLLKNHPYTIPSLAKIWREVLGKTLSPDTPITEIESWMYEWCNSDILPLAYIALYGSKPVGICSLQVNDGIRPDLMPWLGDLCVDRHYQKQRIGQSLIDATKRKAIELGFETLYLFAFEPRITKYYEKLGWKETGMDKYKDHAVTVMEALLR